MTTDNLFDPTNPLSPISPLHELLESNHKGIQYSDDQSEGLYPIDSGDDDDREDDWFQLDDDLEFTAPGKADLFNRVLLIVALTTVVFALAVTALFVVLRFVAF
jgi:hypothetical protein